MYTQETFPGLKFVATDIIPRALAARQAAERAGAPTAAGSMAAASIAAAAAAAGAAGAGGQRAEYLRGLPAAELADLAKRGGVRAGDVAVLDKARRKETGRDLDQPRKRASLACTPERPWLSLASSVHCAAAPGQRELCGF